MQTLIVHAGRHKTGTTTLQKFLRANGDLLENEGYFYPPSRLKGDGHHEIGALLTRSSIRELGRKSKRTLEARRKEFMNEVGGIDETIIISSEAFQNCDPTVVMNFFKGFDTKVVIYLREQTKYLISSYAQKVRATRYTDSIEKFYETTFTENYSEYVNSWHQEFGKNLTFRIYDRNELIGQDIVVDFMCGILQIDKEKVMRHYEARNSNPTLTRALLEYKIALNRQPPLSDDHARMVFNKLSILAEHDKSGKLQVSQAIVDKLETLFSDSNKRIAQQYFDREELFAPYKVDTANNPSEITASDLENIRNKLVELAPDLDASLPTSIS